jgi:hypothetical protein
MDYNALTVAKLKDELKERDISSSGLKLKKDFVHRLLQDDEENKDKVHGVAPVEEKELKQQQPIESSEETMPSPQEEKEEEQVMPTTSTPEAIKLDEPASADAKKRKRSTSDGENDDDDNDEAHKKIKQQDENIPDTLMPHVPLDQPAVTLQPMATSDDLTLPFDDKPKSDTSITTPAIESDTIITTPAIESDSTTTTPAIHPATRALYIRHLVRPINPTALRDHLEDAARPPTHTETSGLLVQDCHVDALRTHAFILFSSISAASRARAATHDRIWPQEPMRKQLWVDFFPDERFQHYVDTEKASGGSRPSQAKRWELAYTVDEQSGQVNVELVEAGNVAAPPIPTGPRDNHIQHRPVSSHQHSPPHRSSTTQQHHKQQARNRSPSPPPPRRHQPTTSTSPSKQKDSAPFLHLDALFPHTTTKPKLYYKPVSSTLASDRLDELDRETSRDWDARVDFRRNGAALGRGLDMLKRYTFEDGHVLVDGGPEFGGGRAFGGNRGGGGRGRNRRR